MKKKGILHPEISYLVASIGHTEYIVIADKGFPVSDDANRINLGITENLPTVLQVLEVLKSELQFDRILVTDEMKEVSPERFEVLEQSYSASLFETVTHEEFKELSKKAKGVIKTGDICPYANLIIVSG